MKLIKTNTKTNYRIDFSEDEIQLILSSLYCSYFSDISTLAEDKKRLCMDMNTELLKMINHEN
jgi:hypothetical protein